MLVLSIDSRGLISPLSCNPVLLLIFNDRHPRVTISHAHGALRVHIAVHNQAVTNRLLLLIFSAAFIGCLGFFVVDPLLIHGFSRDSLLVLPFLAFLIIWFILAVRSFGWRAFGTEEILVDRNVLEWRRTAIWRVRTFTASATDISDVRAVTPWHGLSNHVEFTIHGRARCIGDMLLRDEAIELASALKHALRLS